MYSISLYIKDRVKDSVNDNLATKQISILASYSVTICFVSMRNSCDWVAGNWIKVIQIKFSQPYSKLYLKWMLRSLVQLGQSTVYSVFKSKKVQTACSNITSKGVFTWRRASPLGRASPLCRDPASQLNYLSKFVFVYMRGGPALLGGISLLTTEISPRRAGNFHINGLKRAGPPRRAGSFHINALEGWAS